MDASLPTQFLGLLSASYKNRRETWDSYYKADGDSAAADQVPGVSSSEGSVVFHRAVHSTPSSRTRLRSVETDMPTTVDGSPSTREMNAPPRLSTVKAPATCSGSPEATYTSISASVTSPANVTDASATACTPRGAAPGES